VLNKETTNIDCLRLPDLSSKELHQMSLVTWLRKLPY